MNKKKVDASSDQFVLSYELLKLMRWVVEHHDEEFKQFIGSVLSQEFSCNGTGKSTVHSQEDAQFAIIDFLTLMEVLVLELKNEHVATSMLQKQLMPAIAHIDKTCMDTETITSSVVDATAKFERHPEKNPQELLYKELLKRWKPAKKAIQN